MCRCTWPECFHMDRINRWRGLAKFTTRGIHFFFFWLLRLQRRLLPYQWRKETLRLESAAHVHLLTVLCGLTLPVLPSLDSNQRPVLREMKEKQVRPVSGTSARSSFALQQFWVHLTLWLLLFFQTMRRSVTSSIVVRHYMVATHSLKKEKEKERKVSRQSMPVALWPQVPITYSSKNMLN